MNKLILGLYGQVGTGKSTISLYLQQKGWQYINQDKLGHQVLEEYPQELSLIFGNEVLENNIIDRKKLGELVFNNVEKLNLLMEFSYPIIIQKTNDLLKSNISTIIEGAFFYKVRQQIPYHYLLYVSVSESILFQRLINRGHTQYWIEKVFASQKDIADHSYLADFHFSNNTDQQSLYQQIDQMLQQITV